jgi:hypothetical protein
MLALLLQKLPIFDPPTIMITLDGTVISYLITLTAVWIRNFHTSIEDM